MENPFSSNSWAGKLQKYAPWAGWAIGMLVVFAPVFFTGFGVVSGGRGDPRLINYTLEHGFQWLIRNPVHLNFWDPPIFFPYPNVSAFTDVLLGSGLLYWPWRLLGCQPDISFVLWVLSVCSANFAASYWLLRFRFQLAAAASSVGAYLFTFGSIRMANIGHLQLFPQFWVLLGVIAVLGIFDNHACAARRRVCIAVLAATAVLQAYTAFYTFYFFSLLLLLVILIALVNSTTRAPLLEMIRHNAVTLALTSTAATIALLPLACHYLEAYAVFGDFNLNMDLVPKPYSWLLMGPRNIIYGSIQRSGGILDYLRHPNQSNGLGITTLLAVLFGLYSLRKRQALVLLVAASIILAAIATSYGDFTPWSLLRVWVPGAGAIRALGRISMVLLLPASIGLGAAIQRLGTRWLGIPAVLLGIVCVAEQAHLATWIDLEYERSHVQSISEQVPFECTAFYLVCLGTGSASPLDAMWTQLLSNVPTVNGRYGHFPPDYGLRRRALGKFPDKQKIEAALNKWASLHNLAPEDICWVEYPGYKRPGKDKRYSWPTLHCLKQLLRL